MSKRQNLLAVWQQIPVANRTVEVNTKTGFSLTAGSYSVRASATQSAAITIANAATTNTAAISSVTTARATVAFTGEDTDNNTAVLNSSTARLTLTSATVVTATREGSTNYVKPGFFVLELF